MTATALAARATAELVVVSATEFERLTAQRRSIVDHILEGPPWPDQLVEAVNARQRDTGRDVEL